MAIKSGIQYFKYRMRIAGKQEEETGVSLIHNYDDILMN
jgi:hypothetical protein